MCKVVVVRNERIAVLTSSLLKLPSKKFSDTLFSHLGSIGGQVQNILRQR